MIRILCKRHCQLSEIHIHGLSVVIIKVDKRGCKEDVLLYLVAVWSC